LAKYRVKVLCVCGSGIVTSSMLMMRVKDVFDEEKIPCTVDTTSPFELAGLLRSGTVDMIVSTTPVDSTANIQCPVIQGHALLSGIGEAEVIEEIRQIGRQIVAAHTPA
jgi:PTS system galactitol-specific IIB component